MGRHDTSFCRFLKASSTSYFLIVISDQGGNQSGVVSLAELMPEFNLEMLSDRLRGFVVTVRAVSTNAQGQAVTGAELKTVVAEGYPPLRLFTN